MKTGLKALKLGYQKVASKPGGLALDYVRGGLFDPATMKVVPPDAPGVDNDLKDLLEAAFMRAMEQGGATVYAIGEKWGPEATRKDKYFQFKPGNGMHDIHMNQGNGEAKYSKYNGVWQDGAVVIEHEDGKWLGIFLAFQSQTFDTDEQGNPKGMRPRPIKKTTKKSTKKAVKKAAKKVAKKVVKKAPAKKAPAKKAPAKKAPAKKTVKKVVKKR